MQFMKRPVIENQVTIRKKVYHYLRERILTGAIVPGERLVETKIAKEIGISRTPIREALHNLEVEKLVKPIPRVGYVVEKMSARDLEQICELREVIEALAARRAVEKAHEKLLKELGRNMARQEREVSRGNFRSYIDLDTQFHEIIAQLSGSDRIFELVRTLRRHMLRYGLKAALFTDTALRSMDGHRRIYRAIEEGDPDAVTEAVRLHLRTAREDIVEYVFGGSREGTAE
jgi:GntR family transcriptional regulator, rspAB operon transcriptional repressor